MNKVDGQPVVGKVSFHKRVGHLIAVGGVPAAVAGGLGDFFGPVGGWVVTGGLGVLAIALGVYLFATLFTLEGSESRPWWYRFVPMDEELGWMWSERSAFKVHGVHVVILFGLVSLFFSGKTLANLADGGALAKEFEPIALAQKQIGIQEEILDELKRTSKKLDRLDEKAENFKKEVSDDPRKELANLGIEWSDKSIELAVLKADLRTVDLFVKSHYVVGHDRRKWLALKAIRSANDNILNQVAELVGVMTVSDCMFLFDQRDVKDLSRAQKSFVRGLCSSESGRIQK